MATLDLTNRKTLEELQKLPKPNNENLRSLFQSVDRVVIKNGGVYNNKALTDGIIITLSQQEEILELQTLLEIDELQTGFYCMCLGDYAIELYSGNHIQATIGFHHGVSIRYDLWNGDAELAKSDELLHFLSSQGLVKPLQDKIEVRKKLEEDKDLQNKWLLNSPKCFAKYWNQIIGFDNSDYLSLLIKDFRKEEPDLQNQISNLLQLLGSRSNSWTEYPSYEQIPLILLLSFDFNNIISAYQNSNKNDKIRIGLGRFLCSVEFKKERKKYLQAIPDNVIADIERCLKQRHNPKPIIEIIKLRDEKSIGLFP